MRKLYTRKTTKILIKLLAKIRVVSFSTRKRVLSFLLYPSSVEGSPSFCGPGSVLSTSGVEG